MQHLEHLLFYGADMDGRNASGNSPLHVCAVNNQEACARMLLFRGAQRGAQNFANQTPYQVFKKQKKKLNLKHKSNLINHFEYYKVVKVQLTSSSTLVTGTFAQVVLLVVIL